MTPKQKAAIKHTIKQKWQAGEITQAEYDAMVERLQALADSGASLQDANKALGLYSRKGKPKDSTDSAVARLEEEFRTVYGTAAAEMQEKLRGFKDKYQTALAEKQRQLRDGEITQEEFYDWINGKNEIMDIMRDKIDQATGVMLEANRKAVGMVNGETVGVFAENAMWQSYQLERDTNMGLMFSVYDEHTAEILIRDNPELLPRKKEVNGQKDQAWNRKIISNSVLQALVQGESIPALAKRISTQTGETNMKAMVRYARTAMTGAQNMGRIAMLQRAKDMGILVKKVWMATLDSRTRDSHQHMDGVAIEVDEEFETPLGSKMKCPGDMSGKPGDVWNCRCTLIYRYDGFPDRDAQRIAYDEFVDADGKKHRESHLISDMTYDEWKAMRTSSGAGASEPSGGAKKPVDRIRELIANHTGSWSNDELREVGQLAHEMITGEQLKDIDKLTAERDKMQKEVDGIRAELDKLNADIKYARASWKPTREVNDMITEYNRLVGEYNAAVDRLNGAKNKITAAQADRMTSVLSQIRAVGGVDNSTMQMYMAASRRSKTTDAVVEAMNGYPAEWLAKSGRYGLPLRPKWTNARAYYSPGDGEIRVSGKRSTNTHELGHRFEQVVPGIREAEQAYYTERTAGESLEWLGPGYDFSERTRKDKFLNPYMGKDYGGQAFELVSMGFEYAYSDYDLLSQDEDMRDWILGILMCL